MKRYRLRLFAAAEDSLHIMPPGVARQADEIIKDLAEDPYPPDSASLGRELTNRYRIAVDGWRIIYLVNDRDRIVSVLDIRRRDQDTYPNVP